MSHPRTTEPSSTATPFPDTDQVGRARRSKSYYAWVTLFFAANLATLVLLGYQHSFLALVAFFLPAPWYAYQVLKPSARGLGPVVTRFTTPRREVWLTIDDGPEPEITPKILDLLKAHDARATFFLIGEKALRHPELVAEIIRHGHTVGNHTHTHPCSWFWCGSARKTATQIDCCADALRQTGAASTRWFRSPVGLKNHSLHAQLAQRGLDLVLWSARGYDTICHDPAKALARITAKLQPGTIILVHEKNTDCAAQTELLTSLLAHLAREGYACVLPPSEALVRES